MYHFLESHERNYLYCSVSHRGAKPGQHQQSPEFLQTPVKHQLYLEPKFTNPPAETALGNERCALVEKYCCTNFSSAGLQSWWVQRMRQAWELGFILRHFLQQLPIVLASNCLRHKQSEKKNWQKLYKQRIMISREVLEEVRA